MSALIRLLASFIALMMAMGIGRFALTPQMPHLLSEGQIDRLAAGPIAAANYLGYFVGAVDSIRPQPSPRAWSPVWRAVVVRAADPGLVLGTWVLAAPAVALRYRRCQCLYW
jgi:hypothetical protein